MARALLMDYGGVLTSSIADSFRAFCADEGIAIDVFKRALFGDGAQGSSPIARVETGAITQDEFDALVGERLCAATGLAIEPAGLKARMFARVVPDEAMRALVARARGAGIRTVLVSNSWGGDDYPLVELEPLFDVMLISGHIGLRKPEPEIYLRAADDAGCSPGECVFVDDLDINVSGAQAVGMVGVLHRRTDETCVRVQELLGLPTDERPARG